MSTSGRTSTSATGPRTRTPSSRTGATTAHASPEEPTTPTSRGSPARSTASTCAPRATRSPCSAPPRTAKAPATSAPAHSAGSAPAATGSTYVSASTSQATTMNWTRGPVVLPDVGLETDDDDATSTRCLAGKDLQGPPCRARRERPVLPPTNRSRHAPRRSTPDRHRHHPPARTRPSARVRTPPRRARLQNPAGQSARPGNVRRHRTAPLTTDPSQAQVGTTTSRVTSSVAPPGPVAVTVTGTSPGARTAKD